MAGGSAPRTSASPPVFANGSASDPIIRHVGLERAPPSSLMPDPRVLRPMSSLSRRAHWTGFLLHAVWQPAHVGIPLFRPEGHFGYLPLLARLQRIVHVFGDVHGNCTAHERGQILARLRLRPAS